MTCWTVCAASWPVGTDVYDVQPNPVGLSSAQKKSLISLTLYRFRASLALSILGIKSCNAQGVGVGELS